MRGQPDYGLMAPTSAVAGISDVGELAARMNSIIVFDRRGDVVRAEDFEGSIHKFNTAIFGVGSGIILDDTTALSGSQSARLTSGIAVGDFAQASFLTAPYPTSRLGIKISLVVTINGGFFDLTSEYYSGTHLYDAAVRIDCTTSQLYYRNAVPAWVLFGPLIRIHRDNRLFHNIKLVVDYPTSTYQRFLFDAIEVDMSAIPMRTVASAILTHHNADFTLTEQLGLGTDMWIDDYVLTIDEP